MLPEEMPEVDIQVMIIQVMLIHTKESLMECTAGPADPGIAAAAAQEQVSEATAVAEVPAAAVQIRYGRRLTRVSLCQMVTTVDQADQGRPEARRGQYTFRAQLRLLPPVEPGDQPEEEVPDVRTAAALAGGITAQMIKVQAGEAAMAAVQEVPAAAVVPVAAHMVSAVVPVAAAEVPAVDQAVHAQGIIRPIFLSVKWHTDREA